MALSCSLPTTLPSVENRPRLSVSPLTIKAGLKWIKQTHRRLPNLQGGMWCVAAWRGEAMIGVAIVGRPTARMLDTGKNLQVLRVATLENDCSTSGNKNANSKLYGVCASIAKLMGSDNLFTYIHDDEPGTSLKASGWIKDPQFVSVGGEWSRPSRRRNTTVEPGIKVRWFTPWSKMVIGAEEVPWY